MDTFKKIYQQIQRNYKALEAVKTESAAIDSQWRTIPDRVERKAEFSALLERVKELEEKKNDLSIKGAFLRNNARLALWNDAAAGVLSVWNEYAGKQYGDKTREKIREEIKARTGCTFWIESAYSAPGFTISPAEIGSNTYNVTAHARYNDGNPAQMLTDNRIQAVKIDDFQISYINRNYVENIPAAVKKAKKLYENARKAQEKLETACHDYTALSVDGMPEANPRTRLYNTLRM